MAEYVMLTDETDQQKRLSVHFEFDRKRRLYRLLSVQI